MDGNDPSTLPEVLRRTVLKYPARTALGAYGGPVYSYADVWARVQAARHRLQALGVRPGERVAIISENRPEWGIAFFGILSLGAVAVPILPDFHPAEILNILRHSESSAAFLSARQAARLSELPEAPLKGMITMEEVRGLEPPPGATADSVEAEGAPDALAAIVYTSGTTGFSKGVMLSHRNIIFDARSVLAIVDLTREDRLLSILPLAHTYECTIGLVTPVMLGASVCYLDKPPSAAVLLPAMAEVRPTILLSVPLIIEKIYKAKIQPALARPRLRALMRVPPLRSLAMRLMGRRLVRAFGGSLRVFAIGGAPLAADVEEFLREARFPYAMGYGLTETAPLSAGDAPTSTRFRSTGRALPGVRIMIADPDPHTGEGEILIRGPNVMLGYFRDPVRTAEAFTSGGWLRTGDLGCLDGDGYLFIKGRLKNMILGPSGKNIYPEEIESALNACDLVLESVVFEKQNKLIARAQLNYELLKRRIALHGGPDQLREQIGTILEEIRREVNERLAHFSRLHRIIEQPEPFEKTPTQKIKRHLYQS